MRPTRTDCSTDSRSATRPEIDFRPLDPGSYGIGLPGRHQVLACKFGAP